MRFLLVLLPFTWTTVLVSGCAISQNCSVRYQPAIQEALDIKDECGSAPAYDCCQVLNIVGLLNTAENLYNETTGIYKIGPVCNENEPFLVYDIVDDMNARCDMETEDGGWLVIQRRVSGGTENFNRGWTDYENGFGDLKGEFWYGLKNIHCLTTRDDVELRIELKRINDTKVTMTYQTFQVGGPSTEYRLSIGPGQGSSSYDFMTGTNHRLFTTLDNDNDSYSTNCAAESAHRGAWWHYRCNYIAPNAPQGWITAKTGHKLVYYDEVEMKIRRKSCILKKQVQIQ